VIERAVEYGGAFEAMLVTEAAGPRPAVVILPTIMGRSELELGFARRLARCGYAALVADLYGREHIGKPREECRGLMMALLGDRAALGARLLAVLEAARAQPEVDGAKVAAIGFCFGGLCALDLARSGADVAGVASFHGLLKPPPGPPAERIGARILVLHGWDDPLAPPEDVAALGAELTAAGADWQIHAYGNTAHAFTNPNAAGPAGGFSYDERASSRAWASCDAFLAECLGA
jgi:dienelactone hydrolase